MIWKNIVPASIFLAVVIGVLIMNMPGEGQASSVNPIGGTPTPEPRYSEKEQNRLLTQHDIILKMLVGYLSEMQARKVLPLPKGIEKDGKKEKGK